MNQTAEILEWLEQDPSPARFSSAANKLERLEDHGLPKVRLALLRNITLEPMLTYIKVKCYQAGLMPSIFLGNFDNIQQDVLESSSDLFQFKPEIVVIALRLHSMTPRLVYHFLDCSSQEVDSLCAETLDRVLDIVRAIRANSSALILVHNFEHALFPSSGLLDAQSQFGQQNAIRRLNLKLVESVSSIGGAYVVDLEHILAQVGYGAGLDDRYWHIGRSPYSLSLFERLAAEYTKSARALKGKNKKCLVLDCDNTLWGGIIGEDGLSGIKLGPTYPGSQFLEFQSAILDLYHRGILLALCSKNNEADVMEVLKNHPYTLLRPEHFVSMHVNWNDKPSNLEEIAAELNLGLDSFVFVDDSEFECGLVRQTLPQVTVVQLPSDSTQFRRTLQGLEFFDTLTITEEDRRRSSMYRSEAERRQMRQQSRSLNEYLRSLDMTVTVGRADDFSIPRIAQLTQKTNQFNLTTRRYSEEDIRRMANHSDYVVYYAQLEDRFDNNGIIGVAILHFNGGDAIIKTFLMSCRVIGRGVEKVLLSKLVNSAASRGHVCIIGQYLPTAKNGLVAEFYSQHGFRQATDRGRDYWELALIGDLPSPPNWFKLINIRE